MKTVCQMCRGSGYVFCPHCGGIGFRWVPMTNAGRIRGMSDKELAENNVRLSYQCDIDCIWEEEPHENWVRCYETSDGSTFFEKEDAVEYELNWLREPAEGEQHG